MWEKIGEVTCTAKPLSLTWKWYRCKPMCSVFFMFFVIWFAISCPGQLPMGGNGPCSKETWWVQNLGELEASLPHLLRTAAVRKGVCCSRRFHTYMQNCWFLNVNNPFKLKTRILSVGHRPVVQQFVTSAFKDSLGISQLWDKSFLVI